MLDNEVPRHRKAYEDKGPPRLYDVPSEGVTENISWGRTVIHINISQTCYFLI